ncbi:MULTISPECIES: metallopeptidase TldD-related protein [Rhodomicrobium]|uniref:TldD/PmbA family protein n=1 Tax=Rhodomicrobium TaxID=1068 RepID=UPI000B4B5F5D|nr:MULTISPECIES: metallopeptidase TldD-related protein [Rhodomicrobium]
MLLSPYEIKDLTDRRLAASRADGCIVLVDGREKVNLRFARNSATSNGARSTVDVTIISQFGQQSGGASVSSLDEAALEEAQRRSEEIARRTPADPEHMPPLGPQSYAEGIAFDAATAGARAGRLADAAHVAIAGAQEAGVDAAGFVEAGASFSAMATSAGLFAYDRGTVADLTVSARRKDGSWSGWAGGSQHRIDELAPDRIARRAIGKAAHAGEPFDLDPGQYTVILEPAAVGELLGFLLWSFDAREADEGRSWLSGKGGATRLGEHLLDRRVTLTSSPADPLAPVGTFGREGLPNRPTAWVEDGAIRTMFCARFWAAKTGREPRPAPGGMVMAGGPTGVDEMIRATKRGVLVTRIWYANMLDPRSLLITGLTRDGNFLIENGRIAGPARNFRFNESLIAMLGNIDAIGPTERINGGDMGVGALAAPPLLVKSFNFASRSSSI